MLRHHVILTCMLLVTSMVTVSFAQTDPCDMVLITPDTSIFVGQSVSLQSHNLFEYTWLPQTAFANSHDSNQTVSPTETTTYHITGRYISGNIVTNGDFENGNTGFTSNYNYWTTNSNTWGIIGQAGTYTVNTSSANVHNNFDTYICLDHTTGNGTGKCMFVNGAGNANTTVWQQVITVVPHTDYIFITWVASLGENSTCTSVQLARLQFSINGATIDSIFTAPTNTGQWQQFYQVWNSGNSTSATIRILNQNTQNDGNDFAIDDISFSPMYPCDDSVTVEVLVPLYALPDTVISCVGGTQTLQPLANDTIDAFCTATAPLAPDIVRMPTHAQVSVTGAGNDIFQFQFDPGFVGEDTLLYRICCAGICDTAMVTLISKGYTSEFWDTACVSYTWNGLTYSDSGDHVRLFQAADGCDSAVTLHLCLLFPKIEIVSVSPDFCEEEYTDVEVTYDYEHIEWNTGDTVTPLHVMEPGIYSVIGVSRYVNCKSAPRSVNIEKCEFEIWLPSAITPSRSDGMNDVFSLPDEVRERIHDFEILIYNRWGELVFASTDKYFTWDGTYQGRANSNKRRDKVSAPIVNGIYLYLMRYTPENSEKPLMRRGTITVL